MNRYSTLLCTAISAVVIGCGSQNPQRASPSVDSLRSPRAATSKGERVATDTFALADIGGRRLPTTILSRQISQCDEDQSVSEDIVVLRADSIYERRRIAWGGCPDAIPTKRDTLLRSGSYRLTSDSLFLTFGSGTEVDRELAGRLRGDTLTVFLETPARAFHYGRRYHP